MTFFCMFLSSFNFVLFVTLQVFIIPSPHVVQVIYSLGFIDPVDRELARVFAVEFAESGRVVEKAPGVNYYVPG